jgi:hypothetical protein
MHRDGVQILATDSLTAAIHDELVDGAPTSPSPTQSKK